MTFVFHCFVNLKSLGQLESNLGTKDLWSSHFKIYSTAHPTSKIPTITLKHTLGQMTEPALIIFHEVS